MRSRRGPRHQSRPDLPRVNLLSASAFVEMATRRLRRRFLIAAVGLVVLVAAGAALQHVRVVEAERVLAVAHVETDRLAAETQALAPVRALVDGVARQTQTVDSNMAGEIYTSKVLDALLAAAPGAVRLETLTLTVAAPAAASLDGTPAAPALAPCPGPDPFNTRTVIGCVTLSGTAASRADVGNFVIRLGDVELFVEPFISTTTTADTAGVVFSGSVGLSPAAFSRRFGRPVTTVATAGVAP